MKIFFNILQPIVKKNQWLAPRTVEIIDSGFLSTSVQLCIYVVITDSLRPNRTMIHKQTSS